MDVYNGGYKVMPYFSNLAALGLLERAQYAPVVKKYMDWYFSHLNTSETDYNKVSGTVYDYRRIRTGSRKRPRTDMILPTPTRLRSLHCSANITK